DANDGETVPTQLNLLADNFRTAAKRSLPQGVADDHHGILARRLVLFLEKGPAQSRLHSESGEEISRDQLSPNHLRLAIGNGSHRVHSSRHLLACRQCFKRLATR